MTSAKSSREPSVFYHHETYDYYECMGCGDCEETPAFAVLQAGSVPVRIKSNPENRLLWLELVERKHKRCAAFKDADKQAEQRELTRGLNQGSREQRSRDRGSHESIGRLTALHGDSTSRRGSGTGESAAQPG